MPSLLFAKLRLELEKKEKEGKRGLVSSAVVFDSLSLSLCRKKMTTRQKRKRKGGGAASSADSGSKGGKLFYLRLACRRCTLFSLKNALSRRWRKRLGCSFRALVFNFSLSLSLSLALNSLLLYFKPRSFFFEHGFSSSTRASVHGNRSRERIFHGERSLRLALLSPRLRHSPSFCARLNVISNRGRNCSPIQREREREQSSAKVGQGSTLALWFRF